MSVIVLEIHSRQVFITGNIAKPGSYPLNAEMNVLQLIAQGHSNKEIAGRLKISVKTVYSKKHKLLARLQSTLAPLVAGAASPLLPA